MQFSPASYYFPPGMSKQTLFSNTLHICRSLTSNDHVSHHCDGAYSIHSLAGQTHFFSTNNITKLKHGCQPCRVRRLKLICSSMIQLLLA
jgi:hypothetical protein